jgi:hypothetical protein
MHILNRRKQPATTGEWIELACMLSCWLLVLGYMAAFWWHVPALYVVSLIPGAVSILASSFHDWSTEI